MTENSARWNSVWSRLTGDPSPSGMFKVKTPEASTGPPASDVCRDWASSYEIVGSGSDGRDLDVTASGPNLQCRSDMMQLEHAGRVSSHY
jgi:hypothetical protein